MATHPVYEDTRLFLWRRVREFAVPPAMIETATARRAAGDWAGACAAAGFDVDLNLRDLARTRGRDVMEGVRADLRRFAPDLLRWHLPRIAPDGLLRPGLTMPLARYDVGRGSVELVARTPPAWADAGQRISLALWDGNLREPAARGHPHPRPSRRFRFDLHRHLWDADAAGDLRTRSGGEGACTGVAVGPRTHSGFAGEPLTDSGLAVEPLTDLGFAVEPRTDVGFAVGPRADSGFAVGPRAHSGLAGEPRAHSGAGPVSASCATDRWVDEARIVLRAEGRDSGTVAVHLRGRQRLALHLAADGTATTSPGGHTGSLPVLPDAATWTLPDLELLRAGLIDAGRLHPLVAAALVPGYAPAARIPHPDPAGRPRLVECRGVLHRIGLVDRVLSPLDHAPAELRREELLVALGGPPLPCLWVIDEAHRRPDCLTGVRERLDHGDIAGALAVVEGLLGPEAVLRDGPLKDELESAARRRIAYGLYRAGLAGPGTGPVRTRQRRRPRSRDPRLGPRPATWR
ncbi:hypothetical protein ABZ642_35220 [Streptomyces sp. NPDC007157]|uniref:hypothetical protein n=1 Tax=Streptomyces sp. NPDC007157 TaxID=3154681 RepID=UPI00340CFC03